MRQKAAFGWEARDIDGNDISAIVGACVGAGHGGVPHVIRAAHDSGKGIRTLERREKTHFFRIEPSDWNEFERNSKS